jgi:hypothetical protein
MELRARDEQKHLTAERATQSLDYWRNAAQQILSDPEAAGSDAVLKSWSHDTVAAANLLASHSFGAEAEAAYRLAHSSGREIPNPPAAWPICLRPADARTKQSKLLDDFARKYPDQLKDLERSSSAVRFLWTAKQTGPKDWNTVRSQQISPKQRST